MAIMINSRGTTIPYFKIGKAGTTIYQGQTDPTEAYSVIDGDYWLSPNNLAVRNNSQWKSPQLAGIEFTGNTISTANNGDLILKADGVNSKITFSGDVGPAIITASASQTLYIDPTLGGGSTLVLVDNQWPTTDGSADQVITTDGNGILSFSYVRKIGNPNLTTSSTSGFAYLPTISGQPTGTPDASTGYSPMVVDSLNSKLWIYLGGVWKSTTLA